MNGGGGIDSVKNAARRGALSRLSFAGTSQEMVQQVAVVDLDGRGILFQYFISLLCGRRRLIWSPIPERRPFGLLDRVDYREAEVGEADDGVANVINKVE